MPTTALLCGPVYTLVQNEIYALPPNRVLIHKTSQGTGVLGVSDDGTNFDNPTLTNQQFETAAAFIRSTTSTSIIRIVKP